MLVVEDTYMCKVQGETHQTFLGFTFTYCACVGVPAAVDRREQLAGVVSLPPCGFRDQTQVIRLDGTFIP